MAEWTRRQFMRRGAAACAALKVPLLLGGCGDEGHRIAGTPTQAATVHTVLGDGPADLYEMSRRAAEALGLHAGESLSGRRVFIKPNLVVMGPSLDDNPYVPERGECTKAEILVGIAEQCLKAGADKVTIGDAAAGLSWDWSLLAFFEGNRLFEATDLEAAIGRLRQAFPLQTVELSCLNEANQWVHIPSSSDHEIMRDGLRIARSVYEADHVISVPVLKTHVLAEMTCSMKNFVGVTPSWPPYGNYAGFAFRDQLHVAYANSTSVGIEKAGIAACFTDILRWRKEAGRQDFAIIDGSIGVEGEGPTLIGGGITMDMRERTQGGRYFLLASRDLAAADTAAARVMGLEPGKVKQLRLAGRLGIGETEDIRILGDASLDSLRIRDLVRATPWEEWGLASTIPSGLERASGVRSCRAGNALAGVSLPAGAVCMLRHLHNRRKERGERTASRRNEPPQTRVEAFPDTR